MRLRRIVVSGFKTFAHRTEVEIDRGITAVVGPNGSGKSNLVDAIRWALGETNARELRGARMDEVIHAGGQGRPPMGLAQVDVVIDNEEGRLPLDEPEVEICRRVVRNGDSEYRLNGARVRLRDLERTLSATGLTQSGYAVVAQNDVDGIIEATPAQRRALVEEAAGVRGLRSSRDEALQRVAGVEHRLLRLRDLLDDAEPRLAELAIQAATALEQRELAARLVELRGSLAREEWRALRGQLRRARQRHDAARSRADAAVEAAAGFEHRLAQDRDHLLAARAGRDESARRLESARLGAERAAGEAGRFEDRAATCALQRAVAALDERAATDEAMREDALVAELRSVGTEASELLGRLATEGEILAAAHAQARAAALAAGASAAAAAARRDQAERGAAGAAARRRDLEARVGLLEEAGAALAAAGAAAHARVLELGLGAAEATTRAEAAARRSAVAHQEAVVVDAALATWRASLEAAEARRAAATADLREVEARAAAVRGQIEGALGGGPVALAVGQGTVAAVRLVERFRVVDNADRAAVEAALEAHLGAWLTADLEAARALLDGAASREEVLATDLPPVGGGVEAPPGVRSAAGAVTADPEAAGAIAHCLHQVWLAPDIASARSAVAGGSGRAVLPDGTVVTAAGIRGGGRPGETIALAEAEREARAALVTVLAELEAAADRVEHTAGELAAATDVAAAARAADDEARADAGVSGAEAAAAAAALAAERQRAAVLEAELTARRASVDAARAQADDAAEAALAAATVATTAAGAAEAAEASRDTVAATLTEASAALRAHELVVARAEPEARAVQRRLAAARSGAEQAGQRARAAELNRCGAEGSALAALARAADRRQRARIAHAAVGDAEDAMAAAAGPVAELELVVAALERERAEVAVASARAADELAAAESEVEGLGARVTELAEALRGDEVDEGPEPDAAAAERAEREIVRLERRIGGLGPVNGLAPDQHAALDARVARLRGDHDDLAAACADLRALANHLSVEIESRFDAVFGAVAYHFRLLFEELFPGGRATLRLEERTEADPSNDLDEAPGSRRRTGPAGVEILAQPAGKRLQALSLLSGGERALTALAVILALQHVNPSPFYIFDEVDAPLDDANIGRFTRLLRRLAETQQFVVVTHNHATMAAADALYGVTMGGDGISRLLSVRFLKGEPVPYTRRHPEAAAAS